MRLDKWISEEWEKLSRNRLQKLIEENKIYVNGKPRQSIWKSKIR